MFSLSTRHRYMFYRPACDMRKGFDGLCGLIRNELNLNPLTGDVFVFLNRRRDRVKILVWDTTGFLLYYKQLESGTFEQPFSEASSCSMELSYAQLHLLMEGIVLSSVRRRKRYKMPKKSKKTVAIMG